MEELLLEPAEEPLSGGVVRAAALRAHRTRQLVLLADADPFRPPIVTAAIGMDDRPVALAERGARVRKHAVGQLGVGARADRLGDGKPVVAVDQGRQVRLARRDAELGQVRHPQHVRPVGVEVAVDQILRSPSELALVRAVALRALEQRHHAVLGHEFHDAFGRHRYPHALQFQVHALVAVALLAVLERPSTKGSSHASRSGLLMALSR